MTAKFPNLESLRWELYDNQKRDPNLRLTNRHSFAAALSTYTFQSFKTLHVTFYHDPPANQRRKQANLLGDHTCDPLSTALIHTFSQSPNLTSLDLTGVFDSSLFWPCPYQSPNTAVPSWPNLKYLTVIFELTTPSGHGYFSDPSGSSTLAAEDDDSEDSSVSDEDSFDELDAEGAARLSGETPVNIFRTVPHSSHLNLSHPCLRKRLKTHTLPPDLRSDHWARTRTPSPLSVRDILRCSGSNGLLWG